MSATSTRPCAPRTSAGSSERKIGVKSARPAATAARALAPMKKALWRK
jgi:hypothetical protein